jgi:GTPase Era involved in 16S rRNA processing
MPADPDFTLRSSDDFPFTWQVRDFLGRETPVTSSKRSKFHMEEIQDFRIITCLGMYERGKTWLLNELYGTNLSTGAQVPQQNTRAMTGVWQPNRRLLLLEMPGLDRPVPVGGDLAEIQRTDAFTVDLALEVSDVLLFVVQDISRMEQDLVRHFARRLSQEGRKGHSSTEVIVVVNMRHIFEVKKAKDQFVAAVMENFEGDHPPKVIEQDCCAPGTNKANELMFVSSTEYGPHTIRFVGMLNSGYYNARQTNQMVVRRIREWCEVHSRERSFGEHLASSMQHALKRIVGGNIGVNFRDMTLYVDSPYNADHRGPAPPQVQDGRWWTGTGRVVRSEPSNTSLREKTLSNLEGQNGGSPRIGKMRSQRTGGPDQFVPVYDPDTYVYDCDYLFDDLVGQVYGPFRVIEVWCASVSKEEIYIRDVSNGVRIEIMKQEPLGFQMQNRRPVDAYPMPVTKGAWSRDFVFEGSEGRFSLRPPGRVDHLDTGILRVSLLRDTGQRHQQILQPPKVNDLSGIVGRAKYYIASNVRQMPLCGLNPDTEANRDMFDDYWRREENDSLHEEQIVPNFGGYGNGHHSYGNGHY